MSKRRIPTRGVPSRPVVPTQAAELEPARRDNRGGRHGGNQGGRPSNESQGLESRTRKIMLRFTESEYNTLLQCAEADPEAEGMELAVWIRDTLLDRIRH